MPYFHKSVVKKYPTIEVNKYIFIYQIQPPPSLSLCVCVCGLIQHFPALEFTLYSDEVWRRKGIHFSVKHRGESRGSRHRRQTLSGWDWLNASVTH